MSKSNKDLLNYFERIEEWYDEVSPLIEKAEKGSLFTVGALLSWWSRRPKLKVLLLEEKVDSLLARVARLEEFVKKAEIAFDEIGAVNWSRRARRALEEK
jgi:hypothetical protein